MEFDTVDAVDLHHAWTQRDRSGKFPRVTHIGAVHLMDFHVDGHKGVYVEDVRLVDEYDIVWVDITIWAYSGPSHAGMVAIRVPQECKIGICRS